MSSFKCCTCLQHGCYTCHNIAATHATTWLLHMLHMAATHATQVSRAKEGTKILESSRQYLYKNLILSPPPAPGPENSSIVFYLAGLFLRSQVRPLVT